MSKVKELAHRIKERVDAPFAKRYKAKRQDFVAALIPSGSGVCLDVGGGGGEPRRLFYLWG
jgi:hypothetical protein